MKPSTKAALDALRVTHQLSDFESRWAHKHCQQYLAMRSRVVAQPAPAPQWLRCATAEVAS